MIDRIRRFLFGPSPADIAEASALIARISAECRRKSDLEDAIFDEWWAANKHGLPIEKVRLYSASEEWLEMPMMGADDHKRFSKYLLERLAH